MIDGMIKLSDHPVTQEYISYVDPLDCEGVFLGQHQDGKPNGYVRAIDDGGTIYEGMMTPDGHYNGWGRLCSTAGI